MLTIFFTKFLSAYYVQKPFLNVDSEMKSKVNDYKQFGLPSSKAMFKIMLAILSDVHSVNRRNSRIRHI